MYRFKLLKQARLLLILLIGLSGEIIFPKLVKAQETLEPTYFEPIYLNPESFVIPADNTNASISPTGDQVDTQNFNIYLLDKGDALNIAVPLYPEFNVRTNLDPEGNIVMPILGRISLAGLSITEAENKISDQLGSRFLQDKPEVFVDLSAARPSQITILGEIAKPGFYNFETGSPLGTILELAGGSTKDADLRSVVIKRTLKDGNVLDYSVDFYAALTNTQELPPIILQGGDTIIVPRFNPEDTSDYDRDLVARSTLPQQEIKIRVLFPTKRGTRLRNINLPNGSNILDAIATFPTENNALIAQDIALLRFDSIDQEVITQEFNTKEVINGDYSQNITLQDQDVIVVSRTTLGKVFNGFRILTQPIRTVFGFDIFIDNIADH